MNKEIDTEKIREKLESIADYAETASWYQGSGPHSVTAEFYRRIRAIERHSQEALSLLKPCETCGTAQAPAGEVEEFVLLIEDEARSEYPNRDRVLDACKWLRRELEAQAKQIQQQYDKGWRDGSDAQDKADHEHIIKPLEAKIAQLEEGAFAANEEAQARNDQIKQLQAENRWIPVSERLPELITTIPHPHSKDVLIYGVWGVNLGWLAENKKWRYGDGTRDAEVTHWKPIILPQEKGE